MVDLISWNSLPAVNWNQSNNKDKLLINQIKPLNQIQQLPHSFNCLIYFPFNFRNHLISEFHSSCILSWLNADFNSFFIPHSEIISSVNFTNSRLINQNLNWNGMKWNQIKLNVFSLNSNQAWIQINLPISFIQLAAPFHSNSFQFNSGLIHQTTTEIEWNWNWNWNGN